MNRIKELIFDTFELDYILSDIGLLMQVKNVKEEAKRISHLKNNEEFSRNSLEIIETLEKLLIETNEQRKVLIIKLASPDSPNQIIEGENLNG